MEGFIYQIYNENHPNIHYIGSTLCSLNERWKAHHKNFNVFLKNRKKSLSIHPYFESLGIENFNIRLLKQYDVVDKNHLLAYEQLWINKLKPVNINKHLYKTRHIIRALDRIDYSKNKEKHLQQCKKYYEINREYIQERNQKYREINSEKINISRKRLYQCPCSPDKELLHDHKSRHNKSIKHQKYLQSLEESKSR
jgi:hypothetical protein